MEESLAYKITKKIKEKTYGQSTWRFFFDTKSGFTYRVTIRAIRASGFRKFKIRYYDNQFNKISNLLTGKKFILAVSFAVVDEYSEFNDKVIVNNKEFFRVIATVKSCIDKLIDRRGCIGMYSIGVTSNKEKDVRNKESQRSNIYHKFFQKKYPQLQTETEGNLIVGYKSI